MRKSICPFSLVQIFFLFITLLFPLRLFGADQPDSVVKRPALRTTQYVAPAAPQQGPAAPPSDQSDGFESLDAPRAYVTEKIVSFANYMDRFFGGNRHYQESNQSVLRLDLTRIWGYGDNQKFDPSAKINLRLPGTEGRLRLWLETDPEGEIFDDPTRDTHTLQNKPAATRGTGLAARYTTTEEKAWRFSADAGIKLPVTHLDPFARVKGGYSTLLGGEWRLKAAESVYWFNTVGVGETTQLDLEKVLNSSWLFRSSTNATWLKDKLNVDLVHSFSVYQTVNNRSALIYQASASWITNPSFRATDYVGLVFYRYRMHQKWLFLELSPQLHFPYDKDYKASTAFSMRVEALFDESK